ncbi:Gfo/Idh/MocA family oxidoreductase [Arthrobacter sp. 754]|uniref:Gfo/Idh/MocA family protein n=1 Tax=Arthrobacter sp. 754 TaxID=3156315 RepID=UPI0033928A1A
MVNQGIHYPDLLQWFMGDCLSVSARIATLKHGDHMETEDTCVANLEFASGGLATLTASATFAPGLGNQVPISRRRALPAQRTGSVPVFAGTN